MPKGSNKFRTIGSHNRMVMSATPNRRKPSKLPTSLEEASGMDITMSSWKELGKLKRGEDMENE